MENQTNINRWRLILGKSAEKNLSFDEANYYEIENTLDYLYGRDKNQTGDRHGGHSDTNLTAVTWINKVRKLFPKDTIEKIERHAIEKFDLKELLCDKETLERMEPSPQLLKSILSFKAMMSPEVIKVANDIVKKVVDDISKHLEQEVRRSTLGKINRNERSNIKMYRNFDIKRTIRSNLKNYDKERNRLVIQNVRFNSNLKRHNTYRVVIVVDESGSMMNSVIYSAIMAGIFAKLPMIDIKLVIFDTNVVDLSDSVDDPVATLMKVQLGGGTDIGKALNYSASLVENPSKTIMVLVSDLFEGGDPRQMYTVIKELIDSGVKFITLTALDDACEPIYDRTIAKNITRLGAFVGAMTPNKLSDFIGNIIK